MGKQEEIVYLLMKLAIKRKRCSPRFDDIDNMVWRNAAPQPTFVMPIAYAQIIHSIVHVGRRIPHG